MIAEAPNVAAYDICILFITKSFQTIDIGPGINIRALLCSFVNLSNSS